MSTPVNETAASRRDAAAIAAAAAGTESAARPIIRPALLILAGLVAVSVVLGFVALQSGSAVLLVILFILAMAFSIGLHEVGHMWPAKKFGVRVSEYMIGFGPRIWTTQVGETEYGFKWIPLGGYVRLVGMVPPAHEVKEVRGRGWASRLIRDSREWDNEQIPEGEEQRAFYKLSWWRKLIVMAGGPFMNLGLAFVLFLIAFSMIGIPGSPDKPIVESVVPCAHEVVGDTCEADDPPSAAVLAGLQPGDLILSADGVAVPTWDDFTEYMRDELGTSTTLEVQRGDEIVTLEATVTSREFYTFDADGEIIVDADGEPVLAPAGFLGMQPEGTLLRLTPLESAEVGVESFAATFDIVLRLPVHVWNAGQAIIGNAERDVEGPVSLVGAADFVADTSEISDVTERLVWFLSIIGAINLALFVFNMLPLPPLDGGHIASAIWQGTKNGWARLRDRPRPAPVDVARLMPIAYAMFALLLAMGVLLMVADIVAPVDVL